MVELNGCRVNNGMNLLKLSNHFVLVPKGDLTYRHLFFFYEKRFVKNQKHQVIRKGTCNLSLGSQQGRVAVIYGNISWLIIVTAQAQPIAFILFFCNISPRLITLDISIGPGLVPVVVLGMGDTIATPTTIKGLVGAELYDSNKGLVAGKLDALGLTRSWNCLLIFFMLASMSRSNKIRLLKFSAFLTVTNRSLYLSLNFLYSMSNAWESLILVFLDSCKKVFKNISKSLLV